MRCTWKLHKNAEFFILSFPSQGSSGRSVAVTGMIYFHIILHPAVHIIYDFQIFITFIIILSRVYNEPIQRPAPSWLVSLIGRALHRYRRGQGFESRTSLNFFSGFRFATAKVASITAMIYFHIILHPAVHIYNYHIFITSLGVMFKVDVKRQRP